MYIRALSLTFVAAFIFAACGGSSGSTSSDIPCSGACSCTGSSCTCQSGGTCTIGGASGTTSSGGDGGGADGGSSSAPNNANYDCGSKNTCNTDSHIAEAPEMDAAAEVGAIEEAVSRRHGARPLPQVQATKQ